MSTPQPVRVVPVRTPVLEIGVLRSGEPGGWPVVLLHGFPYDVHSYAEVAPRLAERGADVVVPYLRGYGPTRFLDPARPRSGQQAALAHDLRELIDALELADPIVGGYDWGGRAACLVAMLWPERVGGLVTVGGYNVQDIPHAGIPRPPEHEARAWYQYYLHGERGRAGLTRYRREYAEKLWRDWSPGWDFTADQFAASAAAFDNPDFVDVVVHSYRHRFGLEPGDPAYDASEARIEAQPVIAVPTVVIDPLEATMSHLRPAEYHREKFSQLILHRALPAGHNPPQETPAGFADAVLVLAESLGRLH